MPVHVIRSCEVGCCEVVMSSPSARGLQLKANLSRGRKNSRGYPACWLRVVHGRTDTDRQTNTTEPPAGSRLRVSSLHKKVVSCIFGLCSGVFGGASSSSSFQSLSNLSVRLTLFLHPLLLSFSPFLPSFCLSRTPQSDFTPQLKPLRRPAWRDGRPVPGRILFVSVGFYGHAMPLLSLAEEMAARQAVAIADEALSITHAGKEKD